MKKLLAIAMALVLALSLVACGSGDNKTASTNTQTNQTATTNQPTQSTTTTKTDSDSTDSDDTDEIDQTWIDLEDVLTISYMGLTESGESTVFVSNEDVSFAALAVLNTDSGESVSFVGNVTEEETGDLTITDETNGLALTFGVVNNGNGTLTLDLGTELGTITIASCTQEEAFAALTIIDNYSNAVA